MADLSEMTPEERRAAWTQTARELLKGRTIVDAEYVHDDDWRYALSVTLDNGTEFRVSGDDEGNGPGALYLSGVGLPEYVLPRLW